MKVNLFCQMRLLFSQWKTFIIRQTVAITGSIDYTDLETIASKKIQYHHLGSRFVPKYDFSKTRLFARLHTSCVSTKNIMWRGREPKDRSQFPFLRNWTTWKSLAWSTTYKRHKMFSVKSNVLLAARVRHSVCLSFNVEIPNQLNGKTGLLCQLLSSGMLGNSRRLRRREGFHHYGFSVSHRPPF